MNKLISEIKKISDFPDKPESHLCTVEIYFFIFLTGSVIGRIYEIFFYLLTENRLTEGGFFYGPYLPIYGFGALFILLSTAPFKKHPAVIFLVTIPVTGILEYLTGYFMYRIWATRWWDYRGLFLNIGGYVCLRSVLTFAVGALLLVYLVEPLIRRVSMRIGARARAIICVCVLAAFAFDIVMTLLYRMPSFA